ncbi:MAG: dihydropteroate synthase [Chloroflexi bacterium]|nr:dihydropteroate synthase [Chloroflexota bacterium]
MQGAAAGGPGAPAATTIGGRRFAWGARTYLVAVLNATPDSFSGDGVLDATLAAERAERLVGAGADLVDIGAESTRPGAPAVDAYEEWRRLGPVLRTVRSRIDVPISVDTSKAEVARRAADAGADALNDVRGLLGDPELAPLLASAGLPAILMHNQRHHARSGDPVADARAGLEQSLRVAREAGIDEELLLLDPGFGFGWEPPENLELLVRLGELRALGRPLLIGTSRKSTIGLVLDEPSPGRRLWGTAATVALAVASGADLVRVHDVEEMALVARVADAVVRGWPAGDPAPLHPLGVGPPAG